MYVVVVVPFLFSMMALVEEESKVRYEITSVKFSGLDYDPHRKQPKASQLLINK